MASSDIVTKRIHLGGLTPNITPAHIKDRFKSFGNVLDVEELGVDGLGQPRRFTYFTIQTTSSQLKKCLNIMSGSMWRGCQLRLAEAKPKYDIRLERERNPTKEAVEERLRKRKRRVLTARGPETGKEAQDMRVPDNTNYKTKKFWTLTEDGRLIRPIAMRPSHALPPVSSAGSSANTTAAKRRGVPVRRARMRVINPALWPSSHVNESELGEDPGVGSARGGEWVFESDEEGDEDDDGRVLVGRWVKSDGDDQEAEEVWVQNKVGHGVMPTEDEDDAEDLGDAAARDRSTSPLFASRQHARSASPLFPGRDPAIVDEVESDAGSEADSTESTNSEHPTTDERRSISPLFPSRQVDDPAPPPSIKADEPVAPKQAIQEAAPNPLHEVAKAERSRDLGFLASFLGEAVSADKKAPKGEWAGFGEDDEEDEGDVAPLRLRGGAAESEDEDGDEDMTGSSDSESSDDTSSDSEDEDEREAPAGAEPEPEAISPVVTKPKATDGASAIQSKPQSALKAMFAPAPAQSAFSLLGALDADIELDEELDIPLAPPLTQLAQQPEPELQPLTQSKKSHFDPDPSIPLFFPSFGKGGKDAMREDPEKEGFQGFWRQETDEEMKEIWERDKVELTRDWKKRYREGRKQKKRRGGANDVE